MRKNCKFHKKCKAPLCPMETREESLLPWKLWNVTMPICRLETEVPSWVNRQREIAEKIKPINSITVFSLLMLEPPVKITEDIKGIYLDDCICLYSSFVQWFWNNGIPVPDEVREQLLIKFERNNRQNRADDIFPEGISFEELKPNKDPTIH